ncbi:unnamed protein product [Camellia sinensis]
MRKLSIHVGGVPNSVPETLIANGKVTVKIRSVIEKLTTDFGHLKSGVLLQLWAPRTDGDRCVLTTTDQPFGLYETEALCNFRMKCMEYKFYVDAKSADDPGVLGHVFRQNELAFTPYVMYYTYEKYPQRDDAIKSAVQTSMAFPVIYPSSSRCVGVLELLFTRVFFNALYIVNKVNAELQGLYGYIMSVLLQDAGLEKSDTYGHLVTPVDYKAHNQVLVELSKGMKVVCETHKLLLSLAWVPCSCGRDAELDGNCNKRYVSCKGQVVNTIVCMETFYASDVYNQGFVNSCSDYYIRTGHGVVGSALRSYSPCFCEDVTRFSKTEYPLVHFARAYRLTSSFAICLRSTYTGDVDYVIEFFLPRNIESDPVPRTLLYSILATMKQHFRSFKVASGEELGQELSIEVLKDRRLWHSSQICRITISTLTLVWPNVGKTVQPDATNQQLMVEADAMNSERNVVGPEQNNGDDVIYSERKGFVRTSMEQERGTGNQFTRDYLLQFSKMPLKDAAKMCDVSISTFKRKCRECGIPKWPRKVKRNGPLTQRNQENESVQRAEDRATRPTVASVEPSALAISAQPEEPQGEMVIENEGTSHDFKNLCPNPITPETCHQDLNLDLHLAGTRMTNEPLDYFDCDNVSTVQPETPMENESIQEAEGRTACLTVSSVEPSALAISTQPEEPQGEMVIENEGTSHDLRNPCPNPTTAEACHQSLNLDLHLVGASMANEPWDSWFDYDHFSTVQPETPMKGMLGESVVRSRDVECHLSVGDYCLEERDLLVEPMSTASASREIECCPSTGDDGLEELGLQWAPMSMAPASGDIECHPSAGDLERLELQLARSSGLENLQLYLASSSSASDDCLEKLELQLAPKSRVLSSIDIKCHPSAGNDCLKELMLQLAPMSMAPVSVSDAIISTLPEDSNIIGPFTESPGPSHIFKNLSPAMQDRGHDSEQEFQQAIDSQMETSSFDDAHSRIS